MRRELRGVANWLSLPSRAISHPMAIWFIFAAMTATLLALLLWPLARRADAPPARSAFGRAIFRDQLAELERDVARGSIGPEEAAAARNEISRRLISEK